MTEVVLLGPTIALHTGVHASLEMCPPPGITYKRTEAVHYFLFPEPGGTPHRDAHWGELVDFGSGAEVAHSARWPVVGRRGWVVDTDDLRVPLLCGRHMLSPDFREKYRDAPPEMREQIRRRTENMLAAYGHASCQAVLFRSSHNARQAAQWLSTLNMGPLADAFLEKIAVMAPAQPPVDATRIRRKWDEACSGARPLQVLFCGRDFETKNGAMALRIFSRIKQDFLVDLVFIGEISTAARVQYSQEVRNCINITCLSRAETLEWMSSSHILFHPSQFEGLGMAFLEAAAAGVAVVAASGGDMSHTRDIFGEEGALLVDRDVIFSADEEAAFESNLRLLLSAPELARRMGEANRVRLSAGEFSMERRDAVLRRVYAAAAESSAAPLRARDLPHVPESAVTSLTSREVREDQIRYSQALRLPNALVF